MKSCYLDANLLFYYGDRSSPFYKQAKSIIESLISGNWQLLLSSLSLDEYIFSSLRSSEFPKHQVLNSIRVALRRVFKLPGTQFINPPLEARKHLKVISTMKKYNLQPRDAYHLFIMRENKVKYLATFDNDFDKVFQKGVIKKFV